MSLSADNKVIQSFWMGPSLSIIEQLCIKSFIDQGHEFHLYTFEPVEGTPVGTIIKDAHEIFPISILDYREFADRSTLSNFFRYKLLTDKGGWWVDTDTFCIKPFNFQSKYVFSSENVLGKPVTHINCGNIKAPKGCDIAKWMWNECLTMEYRTKEWTPSGPLLVKRAVEKFGLQKYVQPPQVLCPVDYWKYKDVLNKDLKIPKEAYAVHLWGRMWNHDKTDPTPLKYSLGRESDMSDVTAIIKTFLRDESLFYCIKTLKQQYPSIHIIVADDGRHSQEKELKLQALGVDRYLKLPWNIGLSAGRNELIDACKTPYILLGDDDFSYDEECHLDNLRTLMDVVDIAAGKVYNKRTVQHKDYKQPEGWDNFGGNFITEGNTVYRTNFEGVVQHYLGVPYERADLVLNFFVARVSALKQVRWDNNIKLGYEHQDFFMRAKKLNIKIALCPSALALHKVIDDSSQEYLTIRADHQKYAELFRKKWGFHSGLWYWKGGPPTWYPQTPKPKIEDGDRPVLGTNTPKSNEIKQEPLARVPTTYGVYVDHKTGRRYFGFRVPKK